MAATKCPVDRDVFLESARPMPLTIGESTISLSPRVFSSGTFGFGFSDKVEVLVDGKKVKCQASINVVAVGSKDA